MNMRLRSRREDGRLRRAVLAACDVGVRILFLPESTEGVAAGQTTAMDYENPADSTESDSEMVEK